MTIKIRMILLGVLTTSCLLYILGIRVAEENQQWSAKQALITRLTEIEKLSGLMHELQKERGLSVGHLMHKSPAKTEALIAQRVLTDQLMQRSARELAHKSEVFAGLPALRERALQRQLSTTDAFNEYTLLIAELLDQIRQFSASEQVGLLNLHKDFSAYMHLLSAKEYLGELRASINEILSAAQIHDQQRSLVKRQLALYDHHLRAFLRDAAPQITQSLQNVFTQPETQDTFSTIQSVITSPEEELPTTDSWFTMASSVINHLLGVERQYIGYLRQQVETALVAAHRHFLFDILITTTAALTLILLAGTAIARLLNALKVLVNSIKYTIQTKDFTNRIRMFSRDEMGIISDNFNELLSIAEHLIKEKDYLASTDPLTGAYNRYKFTEMFDIEAERQARYGGTLALIMFDIDHFKQVNDTFGHAAGDTVLKVMSQLVRDRIRSSDVFARWGGEEFMILVPHDGEVAATALAEKIRAAVEAHDFPEIPRSVTASFGVSAFIPDDTLKTLSVRADEAVYQAKHTGRNRVCVATTPTAPLRITDPTT